MEKGSTTNKLWSYIDEFGRQQYRYGPTTGFVSEPIEPSAICVLPPDAEWEAYKQMMEQEENADHELSMRTPRPRHCPIPTDDIYVPSKSYEFPKLPDPEFPY